jgi:hypothetical protein
MPPTEAEQPPVPGVISSKQQKVTPAAMMTKRSIFYVGLLADYYV